MLYVRCFDRGVWVCGQEEDMKRKEEKGGSEYGNLGYGVRSRRIVRVLDY